MKIREGSPIFNRKQTVQDLGDFLKRYRVRYESVECEPFSFNGLTVQQQMLTTIVNSPDLLICGSGRFRELKMFHDGFKWVIELQRDEDENRGFSSVEKTSDSK